ncbi:unnamed protein product, partial [Adineta steineri]
MIDNHPVVSKYIEPPLNDSEDLNEPENLLWSSKHIRQSQYLLQIIRCTDNKCCTPWRSYYFQFVQDRFIPAPIAYNMSKFGPTPASFDEKHSKYFTLFERIQLQKFIHDKLMMDSIPYDRYCVSIKQDIQRR